MWDRPRRCAGPYHAGVSIRGDGHHHDETAHGDGDGHSHGRLSADSAGALTVVVTSSVILGLVAAVEIAAAMISSSAGVLADGLHNLGDVLTTVALGTAFVISRRAPSQRFPYGYHRGEDLAGLAVVLLMIVGAGLAGVTSFDHLLHPAHLSNLGLAFAVAILGLVGNEAVAHYKMRAGRRIGSLALVADGRHSRIDGLGSLGAAIGVVGAAVGFPVIDPIAGLVITAVICVVVVDTARNVTGRLLDEADGSLIDTVTSTAASIAGVVAVTSVRARWTGRRVRAEVTVEVDPQLTVSIAHAIAEAIRHELIHHIEALDDVVVHLDPAGETNAHAAADHHIAESGRDRG